MHLHLVATNQLSAVLSSLSPPNKDRHKEVGGVNSVTIIVWNITFLPVPLHVISLQMAICKGLQYKYEGLWDVSLTKL